MGYRIRPVLRSIPASAGPTRTAPARSWPCPEHPRRRRADRGPRVPVVRFSDARSTRSWGFLTEVSRGVGSTHLLSYGYPGSAYHLCSRGVDLKTMPPCGFSSGGSPHARGQRCVGGLATDDRRSIPQAWNRRRDRPRRPRAPGKIPAGAGSTACPGRALGRQLAPRADLVGVRKIPAGAWLTCH